MSKLKEKNSIPEVIDVFSDAPDLNIHFDWADIMILPIFKGSGMKVKTCEALMFGKHIIGSKEAFEGYDLDYDRVGGRCETKEEFIDCINRFRDEPRPKFNFYSRDQYLKLYSTQAVIEQYAGLLNSK